MKIYGCPKRIGVDNGPEFVSREPDFLTVFGPGTGITIEITR